MPLKPLLFPGRAIFQERKTSHAAEAPVVPEEQFFKKEKKHFIEDTFT
jgi:hypothetical protein